MSSPATPAQRRAVSPQRERRTRRPVSPPRRPATAAAPASSTVAPAAAFRHVRSIISPARHLLMDKARAGGGLNDVGMPLSHAGILYKKSGVMSR